MHLRTRLTAGVALAAATTVGLAAPLPAARAATTVKPIVFPVDGPVTYTDDFGAPRSGGRSHEGNDLMGKKMQPLLAAVDGTVLRLKFDNVVGNSVTLKGADGWTYHYIHVNNDTPGTDDGKATRAHAFPSTIVPGATVRRGQVVAYMGDSGNAEGTRPHLHFEMRQPAPSGQYQGTAINPYPSLQQAVRWSSVQQWELRRAPTAGPIDDVVSYGTQAGDKPLLCDWDGDGDDEAVIFRAGTWHLRTGVATGTTARSLVFGAAGDVPLCGNLDADPGDEPITFNRGRWTARQGFAVGDPVVWSTTFGTTVGDQPAVGDWDGDDVADLIVFRAGGTWYLRDGMTGPTARSFSYGTQPGDVAVVGDWDGNGVDDAGVYRKGTWHLRTSMNVSASTLRSFTFGAHGDLPVVGRWTAGEPRSGLGYLRLRRT